VAVNATFARDLGLLALDEPTAGLDVDSLEYFKSALSRLQELSRSAGLQVLLVTHDSGLAGLCDRVVDFSS
jgi:DNA repair exonuclease SbcCD ATPase subunit